MLDNESVLIVEEETEKSHIWAEALEKQGYSVDNAETIRKAQQLFNQHNFGLALVNLKANGSISGKELIGWIKNKHPKTDVIVITSYRTLKSSIDALRHGAYDYLVTPVNLVEVVSRVERCMSERKEAAERLAMIEQIEAWLKQLKLQLLPEGEDRLSSDDILETPTIFVDRRKRLVVQNGEPIQLSPTEFDILDYLASNADRVVSARELIQAVQGYEMAETDARPIVRVNIRRLRQKIEADTANPNHIITVRSRGYRFAA